MAIGYAGDLAPTEAWALLEAEADAQLIDVRTDAEWSFVGRPDLSSLSRQVHFISWQVFPSMERNGNFISEMSARGFHQDQPLLFLCRSGGRSMHAAMALSAAGFTKCYNVAEGFEGDKDAEGHRGADGGWKAAGLPWVQS
ncbi:MAG TPA: rhodanese-like domain-containing protein [Kiloniellaceae bacterium]|nr:rhodanese-like domain-containing protein [Kiloniellaceae bacterium]